MRKMFLCSIITVIICLFADARLYPQENESISLVTYYPAPVGVYQDIRASRYYDVDDSSYYIDFKSGNTKVASKVSNIRSHTKKFSGSFRLDPGAGFYLEMDCKDNPPTDYNIRCGYIKTRLRNVSISAEANGTVDIASGDNLRITTAPRFTDADPTKRGLASESSYDSLKLTYDSADKRLDLINSKGKLFLKSNGNTNNYIRIYGEGYMAVNPPDRIDIGAQIYARQDKTAHSIFGLSTSSNKLISGVRGVNTDGGCGARGDIIIDETSPVPAGQLKSYTAAIVGYTGDTDLRISELSARAAVIGLGTGNAPGVYGYNNSDDPLSSKYGIYAKSVSGPGLYARGHIEYVYHIPPATVEQFVAAAEFSGHVLPSGNNLYDLGSSQRRWYTIFCKDLDGREYPTIRTRRYDVAERFIVIDKVEAGDVLVIGGENKLKLCDTEADSRVAGVVSEAPEIVLNDTLQDGITVALLGRVYVKVDASKGPIEIGDLLVTSAKAGYAVKALEPKPGTILGKALERLEEGEGKILVAISLM